MEALLDLASRQYSVFTRAQAHALGFSDRMLQRRVGAGMFEQVATHVYRVRGTPDSWHHRLMAACLAGGPECVASHRAAAALHGFDGFRPEILEVTVPRHVRYRATRGIIVHQSKDLAAQDVTEIQGIPATTVARTLIDIGAVTYLDRVEEAFDGAERDQLASRALVVQRHREIRRQGRNGVGPMAVILERRPAVVPHSPLERRFLRLLERSGLPLPVCQHPVRLRSGRVVYLDCAYVDLTLGYELDGHGSHATRAQRAADNRRASALADLGWDIRRFTYEQVMRDATNVVREVRATLAERSGGTRRP